MNVFRREWGAITFVVTILIGAVAVAISLGVSAVAWLADDNARALPHVHPVRRDAVRGAHRHAGPTRAASRRRRRQRPRCRPSRPHPRHSTRRWRTARRRRCRRHATPSPTPTPTAVGATPAPTVAPTPTPTPTVPPNSTPLPTATPLRRPARASLGVSARGSEREEQPAPVLAGDRLSAAAPYRLRVGARCRSPRRSARTDEARRCERSRAET